MVSEIGGCLGNVVLIIYCRGKKLRLVIAFLIVFVAAESHAANDYPVGIDSREMLWPDDLE